MRAQGLLLLATLTALPALAGEQAGLVAMAHIQRADGNAIFTVSGLHDDAAACEMSFQGFPEGFRKAAEEQGIKATLTTNCAPSVPKGTAFDALWNGAPSEHYILFMRTFRFMFVPNAPNPTVEQQTCNIMSSQFASMGAKDVRCDPPRK